MAQHLAGLWTRWLHFGANESIFPCFMTSSLILYPDQMYALKISTNQIQTENLCWSQQRMERCCSLKSNEEIVIPQATGSVLPIYLLNWLFCQFLGKDFLNDWAIGIEWHWNGAWNKILLLSWSRSQVTIASAPEPNTLPSYIWNWWLSCL